MRRDKLPNRRIKIKGRQGARTTGRAGPELAPPPAAILSSAEGGPLRLDNPGPDLSEIRRLFARSSWPADGQVSTSERNISRSGCARSAALDLYPGIGLGHLRLTPPDQRVNGTRPRPSVEFRPQDTSEPCGGDNDMTPFSTSSMPSMRAPGLDRSGATLVTPFPRMNFPPAERRSFGAPPYELTDGQPDHGKDRRRPLARGTCLSSWAVKKLERFIDDNLERSLRLETMAPVVRLSCSHFARACKNTFGFTPRELVLRRRIERAVRLMREQTPLSQVAAACGFADQPHFSRLFRQAVGTPPGQWRRENLSSSIN
jgi:AraC family transcriptional regulator